MNGAARVRIGQLSLPSQDPGTKAVRGGARGVRVACGGGGGMYWGLVNRAAGSVRGPGDSSQCGLAKQPD